MIVEWNGSVYGGPQVIDWSGGAATAGGTVCGTFSCAAAVSGTFSPAGAVSGTFSCAAAVSGTFDAEEC